MANILVTGGAGYIGSPYVPCFSAEWLKELAPMLDRETLAGFFVIVFFGVVLVLIQQ